MNLEMIFFDMGGTIDLYPKNDKCVEKSCRKIKQILIGSGAENLRSCTDDDFRKIILDGIKKYTSWRTVDYIELSPERQFREFILEGLGIDSEIIDRHAEEMAFIIDTEFYERRPRDEAGEVLGAISRKGIRMGIVSNVMSRTQVGYCLDKYGFTDYFDTVVLSSVYGKRKPHPDIIRHACSVAGVSPENIVYVGNSPSKDVAGGIKAGVGKTVLIDYFENPPDDKGPDADYSIGSLTELLPIIEKLLLPCACAGGCGCNCN